MLDGAGVLSSHPREKDRPEIKRANQRYRLAENKSGKNGAPEGSSHRNERERNLHMQLVFSSRATLDENEQMMIGLALGEKMLADNYG